MHSCAQAAADGSLAAAVAKLQGQPQLLTAYARQAPVRNKAISARFQACVLQLQVHSAAASAEC